MLLYSFLDVARVLRTAKFPALGDLKCGDLAPATITSMMEQMSNDFSDLTYFVNAYYAIVAHALDLSDSALILQKIN